MDKMANKLTDYFPSAVWSDEQMSRWLINVTSKNSKNSRCALPTSDDWKQIEDVYLLMKEICGRWEMIGDYWWLFGNDTNLSECKRQNYATSGWIITFFAAVVQQDCRTVPQVWRDKDLWGWWWEHAPFPMAMTGDLVGDETKNRLNTGTVTILRFQT